MLKQGINNERSQKATLYVVIQEALTAAAAIQTSSPAFQTRPSLRTAGPYEKLVTRGVWGVGRPARWRSVSCFVFHLSTFPPGFAVTHRRGSGLPFGLPAFLHVHRRVASHRREPVLYWMIMIITYFCILISNLFRI